ncbi:MAG: Gfo/Idh/MocA family oxidoreductase [Ruminococcaceae bacterium]|nr:Gfo/Idh/MocA family oxidoreductase [Oscillospiraceae bacterium]
MATIKIGIVGTGRGKTFMKIPEFMDAVFYAVCDRRQEKLDKIKEQYPDVLTFTDYEEMLKSDIDAVILANYFDEHAPFAIKALKAGKHVLSECICNATIAEGVELCRTVEETGKIYMIAENYPYTRQRWEMQRLYQAGELGEVMFAEGEYVHTMKDTSSYSISPGIYHWRNCIPPTYYGTHALAPLMFMTNTMPKRVTGFTCKIDPAYRKDQIKKSDNGGIVVCEMDNGAIFRTLQGGIRPDTRNYRLLCTHGACEIERRTGDLFVWHDDHDRNGQVKQRAYLPDWPEHGDLASKATHGGGDFWVMYYFTKAIHDNVQPYLDVYRGVAMSTVGIQAWRSIVNGNIPFEIPDFKNEDERKKYENDTWNPIRKENIDPATQPPITVTGWEPSAEALAAAKAVWEKTDYKGLGWV